MKTTDLPLVERRRAFVAQLYAAIGVQMHPLRRIWNDDLTRAQRRELMQEAGIRSAFVHIEKTWDQLHREDWREITAAFVRLYGGLPDA